MHVSMHSAARAHRAHSDREVRRGHRSRPRPAGPGADPRRSLARRQGGGGPEDRRRRSRDHAVEGRARDDIHALIERNNGIVASSISRPTTLVLAGTGAGADAGPSKPEIMIAEEGVGAVAVLLLGEA